MFIDVNIDILDVEYKLKVREVPLHKLDIESLSRIQELSAELNEDKPDFVKSAEISALNEKVIVTKMNAMIVGEDKDQFLNVVNEYDLWLQVDNQISEAFDAKKKKA